MSREEMLNLLDVMERRIVYGQPYGDLIDKLRAALEPVQPVITPELIDRCAQRLASWDDGCVWPDSWGKLEVAQMRKDAEKVLREAFTAAPPGYVMVPSTVKRFTAYRRNISQRDTHNELQKNADSEPQFEGVIWTDGTVTLRWLTACRSHSVWASIEDCLNIHGHPEYGTEIVWHDGEEPAIWKQQCEAAKGGE